MPHRARTFADLPRHDRATALLAEMATAPCEFSPVGADRPLALYGAGSLGLLARDFLKAVNLDFTAAVDRNARQLAKAPEWSGVRMLHPDDVPAAAKNETRLAVSVVTSPYMPIERSLLESGFRDVVPFYDLAESFRHLHPLSNGWFAAPLTAEDRERTAKVLARWDDDISRAHHLQFLAWRRLREEWTFEGAPIGHCVRFFIPEVLAALRDDEVFLDAGAHAGHVIEAFVEHTKDAFRAIAAVEPDTANRAQLSRTLQSLLPNERRIAVHDCALGEKEGSARFHGGLGYASQLSETGKTTVAVRTVDALDLTPTFIKLHLEGAEFAALKGARETLLACRPIVAATIYHNADGIWKTAHWLMETLPDYRFLFRAHTWCGTGAVIYGIPQERGT